MNKLRGHSLFEYVWLSVLRSLLFYEHHRNVFDITTDSKASNALSVASVAPELLGKTLGAMEANGMFTEVLDASKQLSHRPQPPASRNNLWFATSCEISKVMTADRIKVLFPKFVLP